MSIRLPSKREQSVRKTVPKTPPNSLRSSSTRSSKTISARIDVPAEAFIVDNVDCFHPYTRREFCDEILTEEGDFLVRRGRLLNEYVLSVRSQTEIKHVKTNTAAGGHLYFCFAEVAFSSMSELVAAHYTKKLPIAKDKTGNFYIIRPIAVPPWVFNPDNIDILDFIGRGSSCDVWSGTITMAGASANAHLKETVALKIPRSSDSEQGCELLHEARILRNLKHPNVVAWRGIVNKGNEMMLVLEFVRHGTLAHLLKKLTLRGKLKACLDVAKGLHYLHANQLIHRNVATRNCLCDFLDATIIVKISDLCLCRGGGSNVMYKLDTIHAIPPGWTAPESLNNQQWSAASDVWSYGVVLWEVFTEGQSPYKNELKKVDVQSVKNYLLGQNKRLVPPKEMPSQVVDLMNLCFLTEFRPDMRAIVEKMQTIYDSTKQ